MTTSLIRPCLSVLSSAYGCYKLYTSYSDPSSISISSIFEGTLLFSMGILYCCTPKTNHTFEKKQIPLDPLIQLKSCFGVDRNMRMLFNCFQATENNYISNPRNITMKENVMWGITPSETPFIAMKVNVMSPSYNSSKIFVCQNDDLFRKQECEVLDIQKIPENHFENIKDLLHGKEITGVHKENGEDVEHVLSLARS